MSRSKRKSPSTLPEACVFCGSDVNDESLFGQFFHVEGVSVHQNCLFFSSGLIQSGKRDSDGILGFLLPDINAEVLRGKKLRCCYCKRKGATIGCCESKCRKTFHFPCGIKEHSLHQHYKSFKSYCRVHKPKQKLMETVKEEFFCRICFLSLLDDQSDTYLHSPCCRHNWFHRTCLQEYALSAGRYFFKCPLCNNSTGFVKEMLHQGICIPDQDASWELEENAFQDLLQRPECGAITCDCKSGRKYSGKREWALLPCSICGSQARHKFCEKLQSSAKSWKCNECASLESKITESKHPEVISKEKEDIPKFYPVSLGSPSKSNSPESSASSLKSITNTLSRSMKCPAISDSIPSETSEKSPDASKFSIKRKSEPKDEPNPSIGFVELKTVVTPFESMSSRKCPKGTKQSILKLEPSESLVPYIVKCTPAKLTKVIQNHQSKKQKKSKNASCCSKDNPNRCIKKMFGLECHNYRI